MERTIIIDTPEEIKEFMALPEGLYKNILFSKGLPQYDYVSAARDGKNVYFSHETRSIRKLGTKFYSKAKTKHGLSFKEGKLNVWFGNDLMSVQNYYQYLFTYMGWNWIHANIHGYITKPILTQMFKGKITNSKDILRAYLKSARINCSVEMLYDILVSDKPIYKQEFYRFAHIAKDVNHMMEAYNEKAIRMNDHELGDLINQYGVLGKKVDFKWSKGRMKEEHKAATEIIMAEELNNLSDVSVTYPDLQYPPEFMLLDTQKKVFAEGSSMKHCLYTNYWGNIKSGRYLAFHVQLGIEEATLGCNFDGKKLRLNQCNRRYNHSVSDEMMKFCRKWVEEQDLVELMCIEQGQ